LKIQVDEIIYASKRMEIYYNYAKELIKKDKAYVCFCDKETIQKNRGEMVECDCRKHSINRNLEEFEKMINNEYSEGECSLRLKIDMKHPNPVLRDPPIFRISKHIHPITKYKYFCYPLYNFQCAIDDATLGITHVIRGKEFINPGKIQEFIIESLGLKKPKYIFLGRVKIEGIELGKRHIREAIINKEFLGWDDPRLGTIAALRRRGFKAETIREIILDIGTKPNDTTIEWKVIMVMMEKEEGILRKLLFVQT
jgi:glutamyl-tRNA synthetase